MDYLKIKSTIRLQYENEKPYGETEIKNQDGSRHLTFFDGDTNTRMSQNVDKDGNVTNEHSTNQNYSKGDPRRH